MKRSIEVILKIISWIWIVFWIIIGGIILVGDFTENYITNWIKIVGLIIIPIIYLIIGHKIFDRSYKLTKKKRKMTIVAILVGGIIFSIATWRMNICNPINGAERYAKKVVKERLKAPRTANFDNQDIKVTEVNDGYLVVGEVDAENSFGALIRSKFIILVGQDSDGNYITKAESIL